MSVTVGIPTTGERPVLRSTVQAAIKSASALSDDAEVLVVVNGRDDAPGLGRIDSPALRVIYLPRPNAAGARNIALAQAKHDTVLLVDDDVTVPEQWCTELSTALRDESFPVATAPVRVWVHGPITAFINYQRIFDSQPPSPADPGSLVTANCGLRRDLLPGQISFDENLPAGDDTDLGHQLWDAGLRFRILNTATPVMHELPEEIEPHLERSQRYGNSTALLTVKRGRTTELVPTFRAWYAAMAGPDHRNVRSFGEFASSAVRSAFSIYALILNSSYVLGFLAAPEGTLGGPPIRPDYDQLSQAWQLAADRAGQQVASLSPADWRDLTCDYGRLLGAVPGADDPLPVVMPAISDLKAALRTHAPLNPGLLSTAGPARSDAASARPPKPAGGLANGQSHHNDGMPLPNDRLGAALDELKARPGPITAADLDQLAEANGIPFGLLLQLIERKVAAKSNP
jgi:glycosyl transferase family 2